MTRPPATRPRKRPRQERALATVEALLEATAQLLVAEGYARCSTNRIARRAGVSIGSLYQYFPNKDALVAALVRRHCESQRELLAAKLAEVGAGELERGVREIVAAVLEVKQLEPELTRVLYEQLPQIGELDTLRGWIERSCAMVQLALSTRADELRPRDLELAAFLLVSAIDGIVMNVLFARPEVLHHARFVDEIAEMVLGYLRRR